MILGATSGKRSPWPVGLGAISSLLLGLLTACGGHGGAYVPQSTGVEQHAENPRPVYIRVLTSPKLAASSAVRSPAHTPQAMQSMRVSVYRYAQTGRAQPIATTLQDLTSLSPGYATTSSGASWIIPLNLPPGTYSADVSTYSGKGGRGLTLSVQSNILFTVSTNQTGMPNVIRWTLDGTPEKLALIPETKATQPSSAPNTFTMYGSESPALFALSAYDRDSNLIVGTAAPQWSVASSNPAFQAVVAWGQNSNALSVRPPATTAPQTTRLTISARNLQSAPCRGPLACTLTVTVNFLDVFADDWTTFAHDYQRTGLEPQATGISTSSAPQMTLRWRVTVPAPDLGVEREIYASPVVYNGNVIVVTMQPATVYDFSAIDGSLLWQTRIGGAAAKTPTIDPATGLVFVAGTASDLASAQYFALRLTDGSVAWETTVTGIMRSAEVIVDGKIFVGSSGGDPPPCLNNGVHAFNELTGANLWNWFVNPLTNPGGGGSVWGAIAYDGNHLVFGTGNACQNTAVTTANGAASLDLSGHLIWSYPAFKSYSNSDATTDWDTGSAVMISRGNATFLNKNGILYTASSATGSIQRTILANPNEGYGFFCSPTTDGNTIVVSSGQYAVHSTSAAKLRALIRAKPENFWQRTYRQKPRFSSPGFYAQLNAYGSGGAQVWSRTMTNTMVGYAAINNGVVLAGLDSSVVALDIQTGKQLWIYNGPALFTASPVVVPSGVYAADVNGNVYAFAPPPQAAVASTPGKRYVPLEPRRPPPGLF